MFKREYILLKHHIPIIALFIGAFAISLSPIFVRLSELEAVSTAFYRVAIAAPVWWLLFDRKIKRSSINQGLSHKKSSSIKIYSITFLCGFFFALDLIFWHSSLNFTCVANSTLLANTSSIFVTLLVWLFYKEQISIKFVIGLILAFLGASILVGKSFQTNFNSFLGDLLAVIAALFYSGYMLTIKWLRRVMSTGRLMTMSSLVSAVIILLAVSILGKSLIVYSLYGWIVLISLAIISQVGGQGLIAYSLAHLSAAFSSVTLLIQPVFASIFAWLIFKEELSSTQMFGGLSVLAGIFICRYFSNKSGKDHR